MSRYARAIALFVRQEAPDLPAVASEDETAVLGLLSLEREAALADEEIRLVVETFQALADPTRARILYALLTQPMCVRDLALLVGVSESAVSHQLRGLRDKRLIRTRKQGRNVFVVIDDDHVIELFQRGLDHVLHG